MERNEIKKDFYKIIREKLLLEDEWYSKYSNDGEDLLWYLELRADTLDTIETIMEIDKQFNIKFNDHIFNYDVNLGIIIDEIYKCVNDGK